jgi:hypothetical protein
MDYNEDDYDDLFSQDALINLNNIDESMDAKFLDLFDIAQTHPTSLVEAKPAKTNSHFDPHVIEADGDLFSIIQTTSKTSLCTCHKL